MRETIVEKLARDIISKSDIHCSSLSINFIWIGDFVRAVRNEAQSAKASERQVLMNGSLFLKRSTRPK